MHDDVAGNFEKKIADEEDSRSKAKDGFAESQIAEHLQLGEAYVDAIEVGNHIAEHQKGNQPPGNLLVGGILEFAGGGAHCRSRRNLHGRRNRP